MISWLSDVIGLSKQSEPERMSDPIRLKTIAASSSGGPAEAWGSFVCHERCMFQPAVRVVTLSDVHSRQHSHGFYPSANNCSVLSYRPSSGSFGDNGSLSRASLSTRESLGGGNRHRGSSNDEKSGSSKTGESTGDSSNSSEVRLSCNQTETCKSLPDGDILIISGDLTRQGALSELVIFRSFIDELCELKKYRHIVFIAGNHEMTFDIDHYNAVGWQFDEERQDPIACRKALLDNLPANVHYLQDSFVVLDGIKIYGTPWVRGDEKVNPFLYRKMKFKSKMAKDAVAADAEMSIYTNEIGYRWAFTTEESVLEEKFKVIPVDVDILITHTPPYGVGDVIRDYGGDTIVDDKQIFAFKHKGSTALRDRLRSLNPALCIFGHYHIGHGAYSYPDLCKDTIFVNSAICDEDYFPVQKPFVIDVCINGYHYYNSNSSVNGSDARGGGSRSGIDDIVADNPACDLGGYSASTFLTATAVLMTVHINRATLGSKGRYRELSALAKQFLTDVALISAEEIEVNRHNISAITKSLNDELEELSLLETVKMSGSSFCSRAHIDSAEEFRKFQLVLPNLYIGPIYSIGTKEDLQSIRITHICNFSHYPDEFSDCFNYFSVKGDRSESENLAQYFMEAIAYIDDAIHSNSGAVLVYCDMGISNSAAIIIAYFMFTFKCDYEPAYYFLKRVRPYICPREELVESLRRFGDSIKKMRKNSN